MLSATIFDCAVFPIIGLIIALIGVFFDAKNKPNSWWTRGLVGLLIFLAIANAWSAWIKDMESKSKLNDEKAQRAQDVSDKKILQQTLVNLSSSVGTVKDTLNSVADHFGISPQNRNPETIVRSLQAGEALDRVVSHSTKQSNEGVTIQFFPKQIDRDLVQSVLVSTLSNAGFQIQNRVGNRVLNDIPTNCIWYGANVSDESIRTVALALIRAGVQIRGIEQIPSGLNIPNKDHVIQIGSYLAIKDKPAFTVDQISSMNFNVTSSKEALMSPAT
jgi:hypothetical protein